MTLYIRFSNIPEQTRLEKTLFLVEHKLELQNIRASREFASSLPNVCDKDQIQQALLAVLINAIEAMPHGGELTVSSRPGKEPEWVEVEISDTGVGIPQDILPHLFEPFFTTKQDKKGVGLGLSVVYGIIKRHNGRIDVISEAGRGTRFTIALPEKTNVDPRSKETSPDGQLHSTLEGPNA